MPSKINNLSLMTLSEIEAKGLAHLLVQKKKIKRQPGRPRKMPDHKYQFSLSYWYSLIASDYHHLSKHQRVRVALECWKTLINRMKAIPADPQESKLNADEAMRMLGKLENNEQTALDGDKTSAQHSDERDLVLAGVSSTEKADAPKDASFSNEPKVEA